MVTNTAIRTHPIDLFDYCLSWSSVQLSLLLLLVGYTPSWTHYHPSEFWLVVVWLAVPTEAFGISGQLDTCSCCVGCWKVRFVGCYLGSFWSFHLLFCLGCFCVILFLWFWVQGGHSFESIYWSFVGGLVVGTVSNLHLDTGLLQFNQLTQAPAKGSASWLPSGPQRCGLSRGQRGSCWCGSPPPWVPRCTQPRKPVLHWLVLWVWSDIPIWNKKSLGVPLPLCLGEGF